MKLVMDLVVNHTSDEVGLLYKYNWLIPKAIEIYLINSMSGSNNLVPVAKPTIQSATGISGARLNTTHREIVGPPIIGSRFSKVCIIRCSYFDPIS